MANSKITQASSKNKAAMLDAIQLEAGRVTIGQLKKFIKPHVPMFFRGYMDTPYADIVIANLFNAVVMHELHRGNKAIERLNDAMMASAMVETVRSFNVDEMIDGLMGSLPISTQNFANGVIEEKPGDK